MISYEVAMGLSIVAVFMTPARCPPRRSSPRRPTATELAHLRLALHRPGWYAILLLPSFIIYSISAVGETNRAPFDLPEAESELVGGFHTEYSSLKFALFFLAEYVNMVTVSALCSDAVPRRLAGTVADHDLGRRQRRLVAAALVHRQGADLLFVFVWLRGTLPRLRYDQFMRFGWKVLIPANLVWILVLAGMRTVAREAELSTGEVALYVGVPIALLVLGRRCWSPAGRPTRHPAGRSQAARSTHRPEPEVCPDRAARRPTGGPSRARAFPVPPMDLQVPPSTAGASRSPGGAIAGTGRRRHALSRTAKSTTPGERSERGRRSTGDGRRRGRSSCPRRQGLRRDLLAHVPQGGHRPTTRSSRSCRAALPRPAHPQPAPGRPGEVHRLRAVRLGLPGRRDLRRGRRQHRGARFSPGERYAAIYQINYARCIFCGLCIEACPTRSLTMSNEYELARDNRQDLIFTKEQLLAPLLPGMEQPPHPMRLGDTEKDYYLGALTNPGTSAGAERGPTRRPGREPAAAARGRRPRVGDRAPARRSPSGSSARSPSSARSAWCWPATRCTPRCGWC